MTPFDKILGAFLFFIAVPAAIYVDINWFAIGFLIAACVVYTGFIVQAKKARCGRCGHYYALTAYEAYIKKANSKRCENCEIVSDPKPDNQSVLSSK